MPFRFKSTGVGQYVASERHAILTHKYTKRDGTVRGVMVFPAHGFTAANLNVDAVAIELANAGFIVASFDLGAPPGTAFQWANDSAMGKADSAFTFLTGTGGAKTDKVLIYGVSGGGLGGLLWAKRNPSLVSAVAGNIAAIDIPYIHDNDVSSLATEIENAYGGAGSYATNVVGHSPSEFAGDMTAMPTKFWHATDDPYTPISFYTDYANDAGVNTELRSLGAVGHTITAIDPAEVASFMSAHA